MKAKLVYFSIFSFLSLLILLSCANQGSLSGGEEDVEPPQLLSATPPQGSTSIMPKEVELVFNENLKLENINSTLLTSPVMESSPEIKQKAKSFTLILKDSLLPNTTYTFNFGNSITDLNEGNELSGFTYVFSTGETIDKGRLSGSVIDATTGQSPDPEFLWAVLYQNAADSAVKTLRPNYVAAVQEDGSFNFNYLAKGEYSLYVVKDKNANYYFDLPNEQIAFTDSVFVVDTLDQNISQPFVLFTQTDTILRVTNKQRTNNFVTINTNFQPTIKDSLNLASSFKIDYLKDSIRLWLPEGMSENELYVFHEQEAIDTIQIDAWNEEEADTTLSVKQTGFDDFRFQSTKKIRFSQPVLEVDTDKIILLEDSLFVAGGVAFEKDSLNSTELIVNHKWNYGKEYSLTFNDSAFQSVYGIYSDSTTFRFTTPEEDALGSLLVNIDSLDLNHPIIIQLFQSEEKIRNKTATTNQTITFPRLKSGTYTIQVILDENGNAQWDTGNYDLGKQPESIIRYEEAVEVRANWEIEVDLEL